MDPAALTKFLEHNYSFKDFPLKGVDVTEDLLIIQLAHAKETGTCPECGCEARIEELEKRKVRDLCLVMNVFIEFDQARVKCKCGYRGIEHLQFVNKHSRYTKRFDKLVSYLSTRMKRVDVADVCGMDVKTVKAIEEENLKSSLEEEKLKKLSVNKYMKQTRDPEK